MTAFVSGLVALLVGALLALAGPRRWRSTAGAAAAAASGLAIAWAAAGALRGEITMWNAPMVTSFGMLSLRIDALAAAFLLPLAVVGPVCTAYGVAYMRHHAHGPVDASFAACNLLLLSMAVVVTANHLVLLLIAWEVMTLSSWALVVFDAHRPEVRAAGLQYLIAAHIATACLVLLFLFLGTGSGSFGIAAQTAHSPSRGWLLFLLALIGFGTKAGITPFHVWLPDAHPAAPSHVSALMSAVMITMGFYGIARFVPMLGTPGWWWPYVLLALGGAGAVGGMAFALAQRDVKRALAYSTIENAGIVTLAMGVGLLGTAQGRPLLGALGWTAALLHLWNHALAKALLFLGFGAIAQSAGDRSIESHGGFLARWPLVGGVLVLGCVAIASMPGLNLFTSEWLLLRGLLDGAVALDGGARITMLGAIAIIALTGGLAVACFARIAGVSLLGTPRTRAAAQANEPGPIMWVPLALLAAGCVITAMMPDRIAAALGVAVSAFVPATAATSAAASLRPLALLAPVLVAAAILLLALHRLAGARSLRRSALTWSCGHPGATPAMQYTASSFSEPLTRVLGPVLHTEVAHGFDRSDRFAIRTVTWASTTPDRLLAGFYRPAFALVARMGARLRDYHQPRVSRSLLYIVITVLVLMALLFLPAVRR